MTSISRAPVHARRIAVIAVIALALSATPASASTSGPLQQGAGGGVITSLEVTSVREVAGLRFEDRTIGGVVWGTLNGSFTQRVSGIVQPSGRVTFSGTFVFTGTIAGCGDAVQTVRLGVVGQGDIPEPGFPLTRSSVWVQQSTGSLVTGWGTVDQAGPNLSYQVGYLCR
jgi:hypothetical protein